MKSIFYIVDRKNIKGRLTNWSEERETAEIPIREIFFTMSMVKSRNMLPREAAESPSLEISKAQVEKGLSKLI